MDGWYGFLSAAHNGNAGFCLHTEYDVLDLQDLFVVFLLFPIT